MKDFNDKSEGKHAGKPQGRIAMADGDALLPLGLPPTNTIRWVASRKAQVVAAVHAGTFSVLEACRRYRLSPEEFLEWERHYNAGTLKGPRTSVQRRALH